ncbi:uncharacterized protein LOC131611028 [Vicia villosa]|uniref:uncharacterized protein LOC131611028 n=1 Tax=Vicia villosa TaxID=3911 RepID=UPI00273AD79D|nr:uncharacterized protein LOC131611028 [Vicia villosa]
MQKTRGFSHHAKCRNLALTNLAFADDILLFCRGDVISINLLMKAFNKFSDSTGLIFNPRKCKVFFGSVDDDSKKIIRCATGFEEGRFLVKYLGVPLSSKRLGIIHYLPLIDKITARIRHWSSKLLSYAGRIQLIKSVIGAITQYWMLNFPLPKAVIKRINSICRISVWTGKTDVSRKSPVAWSKVCSLIKQGGLGLMNLTIWNKVTLLKCLWNICKKSDNLWIQWIHKVYLKGRDVMNVEIGSNCTWIIKKILKCKNLIDPIRQLWKSMSNDGKFSMRKVYNCLVEDVSVPMVPSVDA